MLKTLMALMKLMGKNRRKLWISMGLSFLDGILVIVPILAAFRIVGSIPELNPAAAESLTAETVIRYTAIMLVCAVLRIIMRYFTLRLRSGIGYKAMCGQRKLLGQDLRNVSMGFFSRKNLGDLVATITSDASFIEIEGMGVVEKLGIGIPSLVFGLLVLLCFDYRIALVTAILFIPTWFAYKKLENTQERYKLDRQRQIAEVTEDTVEFVNGLPVLKTYNMTDTLFYRTKSAFEKLHTLSIRTELSHLPPAGVFRGCFRVITVVILSMAGIFAVNGELSWASAFLLMLASLTLFSGAETMGIFSIFSGMTQKSIDRVNQIKTIPQMDDCADKELLNHFDIAFDAVSFAYETTPVLKDVSFSVPEGSITALVGLSGSGKTTIANLIARFWDVNEGRVLIGGKDIRAVSYANLLQNISFVFQDVFLFDDTIANNIRIGKPKADMQTVMEAAKRAGCHDFISMMENGYDTVIGEDGARLSGGEKQRISIARALLKDAPILLLDEVTANVDIENERKIQLALQELLQNRTVIIIAHKLSTLRNVEQVLVIEDGGISMRGMHDELMAREGLYKRLWDIQYETGKWKV